MGVASGCGEQEVGVVVRRYFLILLIPIYSSCICSTFCSFLKMFFVFVLYRHGHILLEELDSLAIIIESVAVPLTQYITNAGISRARYTIMHFKYHHRVLRLISNQMSV